MYKEERGKKRIHKKEKMDETVKRAITKAVDSFQDSIEPAILRGLNGFQRKQIHKHFEKSEEYKVKIYREREDTILKVYPIGKLKRLAEQKTQEVLMQGQPEVLPPMGSFERFVIHDYLKGREGVRTESFGEAGKDRHIEIVPVFGRNPKKAKRKLTR